MCQWVVVKNDKQIVSDGYDNEVDALMSSYVYENDDASSKFTIRKIEL